jgi:ABC-type xylose transport system substrate-binding protein
LGEGVETIIAEYPATMDAVVSAYDKIQVTIVIVITPGR